MKSDCQEYNKSSEKSTSILKPLEKSISRKDEIPMKKPKGKPKISPVLGF
jgi:hypothetical protein